MMVMEFEKTVAVIFYYACYCFSLAKLVLDVDSLLSPARNGTVLNSKVLSVTIKPTPASLTAPVVIEFSHRYNVSNFFPEQTFRYQAIALL